MINAIDNNEFHYFQGVDSLKGNLSFDEKKRLEDLFVGYGMTKSTFYNRFYRDKVGNRFDLWELRGVVDCIREFEELHNIEETPYESLRYFYASLPMKTFFWPYMSSLGMGINSIITRFKSWKFKQWELIGVNRILEQFFNEKV